MELWINIPFFGILALGLLITAIGLFGNIIIFGAVLLYAFLTGFCPIGLKELILIGLLYFIGEFLEYIVTLLGVKWLGASRAAGWMAILGTVIGVMIGGVIGGFVGAFLGALITELIVKGEILSALRAGLGAFIGKTGAIFVKLCVAIIIIIYACSKIL